jgi:hypothetical protein
LVVTVDVDARAFELALDQARRGRAGTGADRAAQGGRRLASMGLLLTIAIFWSLVCNLLILPSMLALASPRDQAP